MPDKWAQYEAKPDQQGTGADKWEQYAATTDAEAPDTRNGLQKVFDESTAHMPYVPVHSAGDLLTDVGHAAGNFAGGLLEPLGPFVHPEKALESMQTEMSKPHPLTAGSVALSALGPAGELGANLVGRFAKGEGAEGLGNLATTLIAPEEGEAALSKIPTKAGAGKLFAEVESKAAGQPVTLTRALPILERAQQLSERGHGTITPLDNLYKRINTVNPLDYTEARDRASAISNLAAGDKMNATRTLQAQAKKLSHAFNEDIGDTATSAGVGPQYSKAMRDFRVASRLSDTGEALKKAAIPTAAAAAGLGGIHRLAKVFTH
jgi:hypothetical protein